jgi:type VI secretion system protein ImpF
MKSIRNQPNSAVTLSVLDRLIDEDPKSPRVVEVPMTRAESLRALRSGVRRDLEWLLNTRRNPEEPDSTLTETENSVYSYGLPDFSTYAIASIKDRTKLVRGLQAAVKLFEPRLANVKVEPIGEINTKGLRIMRIRIAGLLLMDPAPEHISFDTTLQLTTGDFSVKDENNA